MLSRAAVPQKHAKIHGSKKQIRQNAGAFCRIERSFRAVYFAGSDEVGVAPSVPDAIASSIDFLTGG